jgi:hypothetical protein
MANGIKKTHIRVCCGAAGHLQRNYRQSERGGREATPDTTQARPGWAVSTALAEKSFPVIRPCFCDIGTKWLSH